MSSTPIGMRPFPGAYKPPKRARLEEQKDSNLKVASVASRFFAIPKGPPNLVMFFVGDPARTAPVSEAFKRHTEASYAHILRFYRTEPLLRKYVRCTSACLSEKEQVQRIYHTVKEVAATIDIDPRVADLQRQSPLSVSSMRAVIGEVKDKNLITFFSGILRQLPPENRPQIDEKLNVAEKAQFIRNWMRENRQVLDKIESLIVNLKLTTLPEEIGLFTGLIYLNLSENHLRWLPDSISNLRKLTTLYLRNNHLKWLPDSIGNLRKLNWLYLQDNELEQLPNSFCNLTEISDLDLQDNNLEVLPHSFGNLTKLTELNLRNNRLRQLPDSFRQLVELEELYLQDNRLKQVPEPLIHLIQTLHKLGLHKSGLPPKLAVELLFGLAESLYEREQLLRAIECYEAALEILADPLNDPELEGLKLRATKNLRHTINIRDIRIITSRPSN